VASRLIALLAQCGRTGRFSHNSSHYHDCSFIYFSAKCICTRLLPLNRQPAAASVDEVRRYRYTADRSFDAWSYDISGTQREIVSQARNVNCIIRTLKAAAIDFVYFNAKGSIYSIQ